MRIKRVLQGTALTALAAAAWMGAGTVDASAAELDSAAIKVDTATQTMTVTTTDKEVIFGAGTYNKKGTVKVAAWDVHEVTNGSVTIDLSKLSNVKDNYVAVKTETTDPIYIKIGSSVKSQKVKYDAVKNTLSIDNVKNADTTAPQAKDGYKWEYRTAYGTWATLNTEQVPFEQYQYQGASLYVRAAAATEASLKATTEEVYDAALKTAPTTKSKVYMAGRLPGKEAKLNIPKQANGPSVAIDYAKGTVKIPNGAQYRTLLMNEDGTYGAPSEPVANTEKAAQGVDKFLQTASGAVLEVRKAATDKKVASKWTQVKLTKPVALPLESVIVGTADIATDGAVVSKDIKVTYGKDKKGKYNKTIIVETKSDIEVIVKSSAPAASDKATAIKATKGTGTIKNVTDGDTIYIRTAGVKATKAWAGAYTAVGKVKIPSDAE